MQINVAVTDANNIVCTVVPPQVQTITIDRGVAGNGIVSIVPVTISTFQYLRITYTNGTVSDVGPLTSTAYTSTPPIEIIGNTISLLTVPIAVGGTGATTAAAAIQNLLPSYTGNGNKRLGLNSGATALEWVADGGGTVTSVDVSGGSTGLTTSGGPITGSGTITLTGTLGIGSGGTGQTTANAAFNALAPSQTGNNGKYLTTDGTNTTWAANPLGTVTSVDATGGTTGLTFSGGPITTSGTLTLSGTLAVANGGTGITAFGTGVATALGVNVGSVGAFVVNGGALGTPSSGTVTNLTGTASININGTVGATTATTGAFTTLTTSSTVTLNGGTANGVAYLNGSKVLTTGSALTFDGTNFAIGSGNRLLVGRTSVDANNFGIQNLGSTAFSSGIQFAYAGVGASAIWVPAANSLAFGADASSGTTEQMRLTSTGLGIGTSSPGYKLDVNIGNNSGAKLFKFTGATAGGSLFGYSDNGGVGITRTDPYSAMLYFSTSGGIEAYTGATLRATLDTSGNLLLQQTRSYNQSANIYLEIGGTDNGYVNNGATSSWRQYVAGDANGQSLRFDGYVRGTGFTERARISSAGNVGIGTSSPGQRLDVLGNIQVGESGNTRGIYVGQAGFSGAFLYNTNGNCEISPRNGYALVFAASPLGTERARIDSNGRMFVGTTSSYTVGSFTSYESTSGYWPIATRGVNRGLTVDITENAGIALYFTTNLNTQLAGQITVSASTTSYVTSSDYRLKENIAPMSGALAKVAALKPVTYTWKADGTPAEGFIAHELAEVCPSAVVGEKDDLNEDGSIKPQGIDTSFLVATLTAAIQEQQAIITALTARIAALESN